MNILQINKFFYRRAGTEAVFLDTIQGLRALGHNASEFSVKHPKNLSSDYEDYFLNAETELSGDFKIKDRWKIFRNLFSSKETEKKLGDLIEKEKVELAHLHNVLPQMSVSVFKVLKKYKIPTVMSVHDVQPMCPNHRMLTKGHICERCNKHKYYNCARFRCVDNSLSKSLAASWLAYYLYIQKIWNNVDVFICPGEFMKNKMQEWGFDAKKIKTVRNPIVTPDKYAPLGDEVLYLGRLHEEKGIKIFMETAKLLKEFKITVAGEGSEEKWVDEFINKNNLNNVRRVGFVKGEAKQKVLDKSRVVVAPSFFYENCSMSILEAMANGRLVVASDRGGNSELISHKETGFLAEAEAPDSFALFIREAMNLPVEEVNVISANARRYVMDEHNKDKYLNDLEEIYRSLV